MREALVFQGANNLNFHDIRQNVIRIPEVLTRIQQAQRMWDTISDTTLDLVNFMAADDAVFMSNIRLRTFVGSVVQMGLLDRYLKFYRMPEYMVGIISGDSPLKVATGHITFLDMTMESPAVVGENTTVSSGSQQGSVPILSGLKLDQYGVYRHQPDGTFASLEADSHDFSAVISALIDKKEIQRLIVIGPGNSMFGGRLMNLTTREVQISESIDLDPMLSWFWSTLKGGRLAIA